MGSELGNHNTATKKAGPALSWSQEGVAISAEVQSLQGDPGTEHPACLPPPARSHMSIGEIEESFSSFREMDGQDLKKTLIQEVVIPICNLLCI